VSTSLEARRRAIAEALRVVATESGERARGTVIEQRLDDLSSRLARVETTLLEAAWERPPATPPVDDDEEPRVSVPAVPLGEGRMSSVASQALFGH